MTPLPGNTTPEEMLRFAVFSGNGFFDAEGCEAACRWAVTEIDRLRAEVENQAAVLRNHETWCGR